MIAKIIPTRKGGTRVVVIEDDGRITDPRIELITFHFGVLKLTRTTGCGDNKSMQYIPIENWWEHATVTWSWVSPTVQELRTVAKVEWLQWRTWCGKDIARKVPAAAAHLFVEMLAAEDAPRSPEAIKARRIYAEERAKADAQSRKRYEDSLRPQLPFDRNVSFSSPRASRLHPTKRALLRWLRRGGTEAEWVREVRISCPTWLRGDP